MTGKTFEQRHRGTTKPGCAAVQRVKLWNTWPPVLAGIFCYRCC